MGLSYAAAWMSDSQRGICPGCTQGPLGTPLPFTTLLPPALPREHQGDLEPGCKAGSLGSVQLMAFHPAGMRQRGLGSLRALFTRPRAFTWKFQEGHGEA